MRLSRRDFVKLSGASMGGLLLPRGPASAEGIQRYHLHKPIGEKRTICPYCSVGCGLLIATDHQGHIINSEGDPDHIINRGALDPKSVAVRQLANSDRSSPQAPTGALRRNADHSRPLGSRQIMQRVSLRAAA